ncbi:MAG: MBL fold metallo-hydrolase [Clostridiales bacterium]|nr:MBL fold metallo-hydrolase [Clostridiales bacterium]
MKVIKMVLNDNATNTYVVIGDGEAVVIDPSSNAKFLIDYLSQENVKTIHVLLTHGHYDHIGAVADLQSYGAKIYMSSLDYELIDFGEAYGLFSSRDKFELDNPVVDGDVLSLAGHEFKVISTPGHTPGSVCYIMDGLIMFSGDTLFKNSIGRTDFEYGDFSTMNKSLKKLVELDGDYSILSGHGEETTLDCERKDNPYVN